MKLVKIVVGSVRYDKHVPLEMVVLEQMIVQVEFVNQTDANVSVHKCNQYLILFLFAAPTCVDNVKNGGETGIDCGGTCIPVKKCPNLFGCINESDCNSGVCQLNICQSILLAQ
jgi:hypothetical protein